MRVGKQIMENLMGHKNMTKQEAAKEAVEMLRMVGIPEPENVSDSIRTNFPAVCVSVL